MLARGSSTRRLATVLVCLAAWLLLSSGAGLDLLVGAALAVAPVMGLDLGQFHDYSSNADEGWAAKQEQQQQQAMTQEEVLEGKNVLDNDDKQIMVTLQIIIQNG